MKLPSLVAAVVFSTLAPVFAITDADIAPAALAGKTLTFTIVNGTTPFATSGTWTGTFAATGATGFTVANVTGNTVGIATTQTGSLTGVGFTEINLAKFIEGRASAVLTLNYDANGVGGYEVFINGLFGASVNGTFTIGSAAVKSPEINVLNDGKQLVDGTSKVGFGVVKFRKSSTEKFVIKNTGKAKLTGLGITKNGTNKGDFNVGALPKTSLAPGASMTFNVTFKPSSRGKKAAAIHLKSNDADESPFDIKLAGEGSK